MSKVFYSFGYTDHDPERADYGPSGFPKAKDVKVDLAFDDGEQWSAVLQEFVAFLSNVYGYPINLYDHYNGESKNSWLNKCADPDDNWED